MKGRHGQDNRRDRVNEAAGRESRDRADDDRFDDGLNLSQEDRERMLRDDALQNQLPNPPKRPGIHWFWASLTNTYTTVSWYLRLGYRPVKFDDHNLKGWAEANMRAKSGDYADCICVNEMLLMSGDETAYQRYMKIVHHDKPMIEQHGVRGRVDETREQVAQESGHDGLVSDAAGKGERSGFKELDRTAKRPAKFD